MIYLAAPPIFPGNPGSPTFLAGTRPAALNLARDSNPRHFNARPDVLPLHNQTLLTMEANVRLVYRVQKFILRFVCVGRWAPGPGGGTRVSPCDRTARSRLPMGPREEKRGPIGNRPGSAPAGWDSSAAWLPTFSKEMLVGT